MKYNEQNTIFIYFINLYSHPSCSLWSSVVNIKLSVSSLSWLCPLDQHTHTHTHHDINRKPPKHGSVLKPDVDMFVGALLWFLVIIIVVLIWVVLWFYLFLYLIYMVTHTPFTKHDSEQRITMKLKEESINMLK